MFVSVSTKKISEVVVQQFIDNIKTGKIKAGDRVPSEIELTKIFNVSRGTLREAMKNLESMGVVVIKHGIGTYISKTILDNLIKRTIPILQINKNELKDLMEIRKVLEIFSASNAALMAEEDDLKKLEIEIQKMESNLANSDKFIEHDINFHLLIVNCSKNSLLIRILEPIRDSYLRQQIEAIKSPGITKKSLNFHKKIFEAIRNRNPELAKKYMSNHLEEIENIINKS